MALEGCQQLPFRFFSAELFQSRYFFSGYSWRIIGSAPVRQPILFACCLILMRTSTRWWTGFILRVVLSTTRQMWKHRCQWFIRAVILPSKIGIWIPIPISWISRMMKCEAGSWCWSKQQSEGRVDCVVETQNYIYIFEFKRDGSAEEALKQIEDMGYAREYAADGRKIYQIGCNFSSKTGTIDGWKMK